MQYGCDRRVPKTVLSVRQWVGVGGGHRDSDDMVNEFGSVIIDAVAVTFKQLRAWNVAFVRIS